MWLLLQLSRQSCRRKTQSVSGSSNSDDKHLRMLYKLHIEDVYSTLKKTTTKTPLRLKTNSRSITGLEALWHGTLAVAVVINGSSMAAGRHETRRFKRRRDVVAIDSCDTEVICSLESSVSCRILETYGLLGLLELRHLQFKSRVWAQPFSSFARNKMSPS